MSDAREIHARFVHLLPALAVRLGVLGVVWAVLVEGDARGLAVGGLVLPFIAWGSLALEPRDGVCLRPLALMRFLPFWGGLVLGSVVQRVLYGRAPPGAGRLVLSCRLPRGPARLLLHRLVGRVPGTSCVKAEGDMLTLHLVDASPGPRGVVLARVRDLEDRVARLFGLLPPPRSLS